MAEGSRDEARVLDVIRLGHPVLRQVADPVPQDLFGSGWLHDLSMSMIRTMSDQQGVGLAAPQIAEALRLFVYWVPEDDLHAEIAPTVLVNPEVRPIGGDIEQGWEGCLSIPGLRGMVPRHRRIKVKACTFEGDPVSLTADGFHARVIQHETDHLDGVVFLDRMHDLDSLAFEPEWERYVLGDEETV
jgi:peptide deformylase